MKKRTFIISLIIPLLVGAISAFITNNQMKTYSNLNTPLLAPPGWLFPIVWTLLYILMGISSYFIYISHDPKRENALIVYSFQLFINFCWPLFFFNLHNYFLSLMILIALILIIGVIIGFLIKSKLLSLICAVLAILIVLVWFLVASGILTNCG